MPGRLFFGGWPRFQNRKYPGAPHISCFFARSEALSLSLLRNPDSTPFDVPETLLLPTVLRPTSRNEREKWGTHNKRAPLSSKLRLL